jgi:cardiolipin synthase
MTADPITDDLGTTDNGAPVTRNRARQLADALTWLRLMLAAPIVAALLLALPGLALGLFLVAAVTDFFDGRLARTSGLPSALGTTLDPLADKILVLTVLGTLWAQGLLETTGVIAFLVILARELIVTALRIARSAARRPFGASVSAKLKTVVQMSAVGILLGAEAFAPATGILRPIGTILLISAALLSLPSAIQYFFGMPDLDT